MAFGYHKLVILFSIFLMASATNMTDDKGMTTPEQKKGSTSTGPVVEGVISFDEEFTQDMNDPDSDDYKAFKDKVEGTFAEALKAQDDSIKSVKLKSVSRGSIVANVSVELDETVSPDEDVAAIVEGAVNAVAANQSVVANSVSMAEVETGTTTNPEETTEASNTAAETTESDADATTTASPDESSESTGGGESATTEAGSGSTGGGESATTEAGSDNTGGGESATTEAGSDNTGGGESATTEAASESDSTASGSSGSSSTGGSSDTSSNGDTTSNTAASGSSGSGGSSSDSQTSSETNSNSAGSGESDTTYGKDSKDYAFNTNVDENSLNGFGVLIKATKGSLSEVQTYIDTSSDNYAKFSGATVELTNLLKGTTESANIKGTVQLKKVIKVNSTTVRAEYLVPVDKKTNVGPLQTAMDTLDKTAVFGNLPGIIHEVKLVPLGAEDRWHSLNMKIVNEPFTTAMKDSKSDDFKKILEKIQNPLASELKRRVPAVRAVLIMELSSGSVVVRASVETDDTSSNATTADLSTALNNIYSVGDYDISPEGKSVSSEDYISGAQFINPVPKDQVTTPTAPKLRDDEDLKQVKANIEVEEKKVPKDKNYILTVTLPSFIAGIILIFIFLFCTTSESFLCKICSNDNKSVP